MKQPTQSINQTQIEALLKGASMLVMSIDEKFDYNSCNDWFLMKDTKKWNMPNEIMDRETFIKNVSPLQIGQEYFVQEEFAELYFDIEKPTIIYELEDGHIEYNWKPASEMQEHQSRISITPLKIEVKRVQDINWEEITNIMKAVCTCEDNEENRCYFGHDGHFRNWLEKQGISYKENPYIFTIN